MGRKPPCRICRSRRWKKNSMGFYVCEFGHQLEGYQEEEGEFDSTLGGVHHRHKKSQRKKKEKKESEILRGQEATDILLQAFQILLRKQIYTLIHTMGFPPELEQVAYEYWTLYMTHYAHLPLPLPRRYARGKKRLSSVEEAMASKKDTQDGSMEGQDQGQGQVQNSEQDQTKTGTESGDTTSSESSESDDSYSSSDSSDDEAPGKTNKGNGRGPDETGPSNPATETPFKRSVRSENFLQKLKVDYTLAICYMACHYLRQPVVFADFHKWVATGVLPMYQASRFLPSKMLAKFSPHLYMLFLPRKNRSPDRLAQTVRNLCLFFEKDFKIVQPTPNIPPLVFRFVQELMLPVETYPCAVRLCHIFFDMRSNNLNHDLATSGAAYVMGTVVMLAKLFVGLDGRTRLESNALDLLNTFPKEHDWLQLLDIRHSLRSKHETPLHAGEYEYYRDMSPEGYKDMASKWMAQDPSKKENYSNLLKILQKATHAMTESKPPRDTVCPDVQAFLRRLFSTVEPPSSSAFTSSGASSPATTGGRSSPGATQKSNRPRALRPGENFVHYAYKSIYLHDRGAFLGAYERVLGHAANAVGISHEQMHKATVFVEQSLFRWWAHLE